MKLTGTIRRSDLEGGHWVLDIDGGEHYQLTGALHGVKEGMRVEVEGKLDKHAMGLAMMGPQFQVSKLKQL